MSMTIAQLKEEFIKIYGGEDSELRVFSSPGRVNLIGEHTDYNGGFVFPAALTLDTAIIARKNNSGIVRIRATDLPDDVSIDISKLEDYRHLKWGNYQAGVLYELKKSGFIIQGCEMLYHGTVPFGAGLSSSASIEVATALAFATFSNEAKGIDEDIDMVLMAKVSQAAENNYVGVNCGIMDQFASAMGKRDHVIFLNCKDLSYKLIKLNLMGYKIVIANTNKKRSLADSKYNERRAECESALEVLKKGLPNASCLGDISVEEFEQNAHLIKDDIILKRARHVIYEDYRVLKSIDALENNDIAEFGRLMSQSHESLRDLYEVTGIELDTLVDEALKARGCMGSRMTGAGFGGCSVSIVKEDMVNSFIELVGKNYTKKIGYAPTFYISDIGDGGREVKAEQ